MVRWGILGAGNIARRFAASVGRSRGAELVAISCRSSERACAFAGEHGVAPGRAYADDGDGSQAHEALLADPGVDAIYLALPHDLHHDWAVRALRAGKAVLCEKPAAMTEAEMADVARVAREEGLLFVEAMKARFQPAYRAVREAVDAGEIGEVTYVEASLCNDMLAQVEGSGSYHLRPGVGGVLLDCGTYCASWLVDYAPGDLSLVRLAGVERSGIDVYADARLSCGSFSARLECAFDRAKPRRATIVGTKGRMVVDELHRSQHAVVEVSGRAPREVSLPYEGDDFTGELEHVNALIERGATESDVMPLAVSVADARLIDAIRRGFALDGRALEAEAARERTLALDRPFTREDALEIGVRAARLAPEYDRGLFVRIVSEPDGLCLFQWLGEGAGERNVSFMEMKRASVLANGRSSYAEALRQRLAGEPVTTAGGGFPVFAQGEHVATLLVSGLHEERDHEVALRALGWQGPTCVIQRTEGGG